MSVSDALMLMLTFGTFLISLIELIIKLIDHHDHK